jgi:ABC-type antimicrobial peptide transport system permease subunit
LINLRQKNEFQNINYNSILIKEQEHYFGLKELLIERYSKNLVYVVDYDSLTAKTVKEIQTNTDYMIYTISIMIVCFVFSILNHNMLLFEDMKQSYAKIAVIGASNKQLLQAMVLESIIIWIVVVVTAIISSIMITTELSNIVLLFGEYEPIVLRYSSIVSGTLISTGVYVLSRLIYTVKLIKTPIGQTIRQQNI